MKNTIRKISLVALLSIFILCMAILLLPSYNGNKVDKAYAADATSFLELKADKTALVPGDTFTLTATITTSRSGSEWNALGIYIGPYDGVKTMDAATCSYFSVVSKTMNLSTGSYTNVTTDKFASGKGLYLAFSNNATAPIGVSTSCIMTFVIKVSEDIVSNSEDGTILFGMPATTTNTVSYDYGLTTDKASTGALTANSIKFTVKEPSNVATLSAVKIGHGTADTSLTVQDEMSYTGNSSSLTNLKVMPTATDSGATIKIGTTENPTTAVASGSAATVSLPSAPAKIYILVTAENGQATKSYIINYTNSFVQLSGLTSLAVTPTTGVTKNGLTSAFSAATKDYTANVPSDATSVNVTPTITSGAGISQTVAVSATGCTAAASTVNSGSAVTLTGVTAGSTVTFSATAADGTTAAYTITFQTVSVDAAITSFTMTGKDDGITYNSDSSQGVDYHFSLPYEAGNYSGKFNVTTSSDKATVKIGTAAYNPATVYSAGTYTVTVTAEAGNTKAYSVSVVKIVISADFTSLNFSTTGPTGYSSIFNMAEYDDSTKTFNKTFNVKDFTSTPRIYIGGNVSPDATVKQTGLTVNNTTNDYAYNYYADLAIGENVYTLNASSSAGNMTYTFKISYLEQLNTITKIDLTDANGAVEGFSFSAATTEYSLNVPYKTTAVTFAVSTDGNYAYVYCDSDANKLTQNTSTLVHTLTKSLTVGENTVELYAKADKGLGAKGTAYTFKITREEVNRDTSLSDLTVTINGTPVEINFNPNTFVYTIKDDSDSLKLDIAATATSPLSTVSGTGEFTISPSVAGDANTTILTVTVTAEDGSTQDYKIYVSKNPVVLDGNYEVSSLTITGNDGVTYFSSSETSLSYGPMPVITVPYLVERVSVSAATVSSTATLSGDLGNFELKVGSNALIVYAYAEDGSNSDGTDCYEFTIIREEPALYARLDDLQINNIRVEGFDKDVYEYAYRVDSDTQYVSVRAIAEDERATITIQLGGVSFQPAVGTNNVPYAPIGEKGETVTLTVTVVLDDLISNYVVRITRSSDKPVLSSLQVGEYDILDGSGSIIDGMDESVVGKMTDFFVRIEYSNINDIIIQATTNDATAEVRISGDIIRSDVGICVSSLKMQDLFNADGDVIDVQVVVIPEVGEVAVYYVHFIFLTSSTNAFITIDEIEDFNLQYDYANPSIVYGNYKIPYTTSKLAVNVSFDVEEGFAEGTYQIYYNSTLKNDNGTEVSSASLNYGVNYVLVNLTSSDGRVSKTVVVLVEREDVRLESVTIDEIEAFATDYSGDRTEYFYSVGSDIEFLNITVTVAEGYTYAIVNDSELKTGINQVKIYLYESSAIDAKRVMSYSLLADAIEQSALKVIYINVFREAAPIAGYWKIIFYSLIALSALLLLILILILIFRPRKEKNTQQPQQPPIIINTPPAQSQPQPQPQRRPQPRPQPQVQPQYIQPQPTIIQAPPQYIQAPPQPTIIQAPPQYVQAPPPQYVQAPGQQQPVVQPIIINTTSDTKRAPAPINITDETNQPRRVVIRNDGIYDVDGFYESANGDEGPKGNGQ